MMTHDRVGDPGDGTVPTAIPGESRYVETNGVTLHTIDAGPTTGRLVVLLHGFPCILVRLGRGDPAAGRGWISGARPGSARL